MSRKRSNSQEIVARPGKTPKLCLYLEDNTPVRTIEVSNVRTDLSKELCQTFIHGYFERDGPVECVEIVKKTGKAWLAYVTFVVPDDAAALIYNTGPNAGYTRYSDFAIKVADDARQKKIDPNVINLERVNDHCLLYILSYLTLMDAIHLCKTSTRMQSIGQLYYRKYAKFSFGMPLEDSSINEVNLPIILKTIGDHIRTIDWHCLTSAQFELLVAQCPNVTKLELTSPKRDVGPMLSRNKGFFKNLRKLSISSSINVYDSHIQTMVSGNKVEFLHLDDCNKVRGDFFTKENHDKLDALRIINCPALKDLHRFSMSEWNNKLNWLILDACCSYISCLSLPPEKLDDLTRLYLDFTCFKGIVDGLNFGGLKKLKEISLVRRHQDNSIDSNSMINGLAQIDSLETVCLQRITVDSHTIQGFGLIKNLKCLKMFSINSNIGTKLYELLREHLPTLHELVVYFTHPDPVVMGKSIIDMIAGMPKLHYFSHSNITWESLDGFREVNFDKADKTTPLEIGVDESMVRDPRKVTFEAAHKGSLRIVDWNSK